MQPYPPNRPPKRPASGPPTRPVGRPPTPAAGPPRRPVTRRAPAARKSGLLKGAVVLVFGLFLLTAVTGFAGVVAGAFIYSQGLKSPSELEDLTFPEDTIIYARDGSSVLAQLSPGGERRRTITWSQVPAHLADAVTAVEDKTFWANTGIDPLGILSSLLDTLTGEPRGGSTITQQLVRQKLLPDEVTATSSRLADRKIKEIIQSVRVTDHYRGEEGKQAILTAYLNQNFYGNNSYGVLAAARSYFGKFDLNDLTLAQAATLAAIPQAPSTYDLVRNAVQNEDGQWEVPSDSPIYQRRNLVLRLLADDPTRRVLSGDTYSTQDYRDAMQEPLIIEPQSDRPWKAPHFVWYVREEMRQLLCQGESEACDSISLGGLRVTTTLDLKIQNAAEKWVEATALVPHRNNPANAASDLGVPYASWMQRLRGQNVWNAALSAIDYQTGEIIAYVGSANYYERYKVSKRMQPQYDVLSQGWRQPGSAFKPFTYATGFNDRTLTAATMLMDVTTDFGGYTPTDFSAYERGPLRVRDTLQMSLNVPAVKALALVGENRVFDAAQDFGMVFQSDRPTAGLSMALGTLEVHPLDLNQAYATIANGGLNVGHTSILEIRSVNADNPVEYKHEVPNGERVISEQAAFVTTDILAGNTDPSENGVWANVAQLTAGNGRRRPAALKTGTTNDARDLNAYGYIAPPSGQGRRNGEYALSVGVWAGNSDSSPVTTVANPVFSLDVAAPLWDSFLTEVTRSWEVRDFSRPSGLSTHQVDAWTGFAPSAHSRRQETELFITGTAPSADPYIRGLQVVRGSDGRWYRWREGCEGNVQTRGYLVLNDAESHTESWNEAVKGWIARARGGPGKGANVSPSKTTYTAYFYAPYYQPYGASWGGPFPPGRSCSQMPAEESEEPSMSPSPSPSTSPSMSPSPGVEPSDPPEPTDPPDQTPAPTAKPTPAPTPAPTPEPSEPPTVEPTQGPTNEPPPSPSSAVAAAGSVAEPAASASATPG